MQGSRFRKVARYYSSKNLVVELNYSALYGRDFELFRRSVSERISMKTATTTASTHRVGLKLTDGVLCSFHHRPSAKSYYLPNLASKPSSKSLRLSELTSTKNL